jgi:hypothetical protein
MRDTAQVMPGVYGMAKEAEKGGLREKSSTRFAVAPTILRIQASSTVQAPSVTIQ